MHSRGVVYNTMCIVSELPVLWDILAGILMADSWVIHERLAQRQPTGYAWAIAGIS